MEYVPIRLSTLRPKKALVCDVFVFYKENYLKYIMSLDEGFSTKISKLKKNKIKQLFIESSNEEVYQKYLDEGLESIVSDPDTPNEEKVGAVEDSASFAHEKLQEDPSNEKAYKLAEKAMSSLEELIEHAPESLVVIFEREDKEGEGLILRHSFNVAALCVKFCASLKYSKEDIHNIGMAAYLHDLGVASMGEHAEQFFLKDIKEMSKKNADVYKQHPQLAVDWLRDKDYINPDMVRLIYAHEENLIGSGYPQKLSKLEPLEEILSLINVYDKLVSCRKMSHKEALKSIQIDCVGSYHLETLNAFKKFLKNEKIIEIEKKK